MMSLENQEAGSSTTKAAMVVGQPGLPAYHSWVAPLAVRAGQVLTFREDSGKSEELVRIAVSQLGYDATGYNDNSYFPAQYLTGKVEGAVRSDRLLPHTVQRLLHETRQICDCRRRPPWRSRSTRRKRCTRCPRRPRRREHHSKRPLRVVLRAVRGRRHEEMRACRSVRTDDARCRRPHRKLRLSLPFHRLHRVAQLCEPHSE